MKINRQQVLWIVTIWAIIMTAFIALTMQPVDLLHQSAQSEDSR